MTIGMRILFNAFFTVTVLSSCGAISYVVDQKVSENNPTLSEKIVTFCAYTTIMILLVGNVAVWLDIIL